MEFILSSDRSCDIFCGEMKRRGIEYISQIYTVDDTPHTDEFDSDADYKAFYALIRSGKMPTTSQINIAEHEDFFEAMLEKHDKDLLHITLSSGLSNTYASAVAAAETVNARHGKKRVYVLDSLGATVVQRIVVDEAERLRDAGLSANEAMTELTNFIKHVQVWFMTTDLMYLKRGGRVSGASAVIGTALNIKPILVINKNGGLSVVQKKIGPGKGMAFMTDMFRKFNAPCTSKVYLPSADSEYNDDMKERILAVRPDCDVEIGWVGPVIGAHTGAGLIGVCFLSDKEREA